jgi:hypothetical protein
MSDRSRNEEGFLVSWYHPSEKEDNCLLSREKKKDTFILLHLSSRFMRRDLRRVDLGNW